MATGEIDADRKRRHRRRRQLSGDSREHVGTSRQRKSDHQQPQLDAIATDRLFEQPQDLAALREARLRSMATPAAARNKMKLEYQYTRPAKPPTVTKVKSPSVVSNSLFGRRSSVATARPKAKSTVSASKSHGEQVYQYVYGDRAGPEQKESEEVHQNEEANQRVRPPTERRKSTASTKTKPNIQRRKTEPAPTARRSSTTATRKLNAKKVSAVSIKDFAPDPPTDTTKPEKPQRASSMFGSFFGKPSPVPEKQVSCLTCGSDDIPVSKSAKLPCDHRMCHTCLKRIFKMSIKDPAHMPPRCCTQKHISLKHVDSLFDDAFKKTWNKKFKEYNSKNRIYCPRRGCGEWIQPKHFRIEQGRKIAVCSKCKFSVCTMCNQKAHRSRECPKDPALKLLNDMAEQKGWVKCFNCSAVVELKEGCNHMTCRCMAEFCMVCGLKWKSCDCPWFNYEAVDDLRGNPIRYQQEMDRRREQLQRDEELARQMERLDVRPGRRQRRAAAVMVEDLGNEPVTREQADADFLMQARGVLAGRYPYAEEAARGLLGGWLMGRENQMPGAFENQPPAHEQNNGVEQEPPLQRRRTYRLRNANLGLTR